MLLKAAAGGGGKGMRLVGGPDELERAYSTAAAEAERRSAARASTEKAISPARHVEIQVLADTEGNVLTLGERECSIQRRHQKLIEESPSTALTPKLREEMESAAEIACDAIGYRNAGTFEFLVGPDGAFYFIELNARLQVEHPVSELCTGIDLVREQLRVAAGEPLELTGRAPRRGHAIELRVNAEDPARDFLPSPGRLERFRPPLGPGVRVDSSVTEGSSIPPFYDSLVAKLIVWDVDRPAAIARALRALAEFDVAGLPTTIPALRDVLRSDEFQSGRYSTSFLEDAGSRLPALAGRRDGRSAGGQAGRVDDALPLGRRRRAAGPATGEEVDLFSIETAEAVAARAEELDRRIDEAAIGWTADRMGAVERNVLRMGVYELETGSVPPEVAISEAVKLAVRYASNEAGKFVNGILDRVARSVHCERRGVVEAGRRLAREARGGAGQARVDRRSGCCDRSLGRAVRPGARGRGGADAREARGGCARLTSSAGPSRPTSTSSSWRTSSARSGNRSATRSTAAASA